METLKDLSRETKDALMEMGTLIDISNSGRRCYRLLLNEDGSSIVSIAQSELEEKPWRVRWFCEGSNRFIEPIIFPRDSNVFKDTAYFYDESSLVRQCQILAEFNPKLTWEKDILGIVSKIKTELEPIEDHPDWLLGNIKLPEELQDEVSECVERLHSDIVDFKALYFRICDFGVLHE